MEDLCTACLCSGRKLFFIGETGFYHIYSQILNEIPVYNLSQICVRVCWECCAVLRRFNSFKIQAKSSYTELLEYLHQGQPSLNVVLPKSHLQIEDIISINYPEIKTERDSLDTQSQFEYKGELHEDVTDQLKEEEHCEPITFADNLLENDSNNIDDGKNNQDKVKITKGVKKKSKVKKNGRIKVKKKKDKLKVILERSDDSCQDNEYLSMDEKDKLSFDEDKDERERDGIEEDSKCDFRSRILFEKTDEIVETAVKTTRTSQTRAPRLPKGTPNEKPTCAECGKVFSSRKTLRYHLSVLHKGNNRHPCPRCGKVYQWKSNLGRHLRSHKARDTGELYCALCDKRFASVATYRQHLSISKQHVSENEFNYTCNECGKKFVSKTRLRDHIDWEHLQKIKFRCQLCNKPFKCHTSLYVHMRNVHRDKGMKDNLCHVCGKSYQNRAKLRYHIVAMHTTETPYQCEQCNAAFGWYSSLYRHVREVHFKMKLQPNKSKKTKKRIPEQLPSIMHQPHLVLPSIPQPGVP